jgi:hypothetical protein
MTNFEEMNPKNRKESENNTASILFKVIKHFIGNKE